MRTTQGMGPPAPRAARAPAEDPLRDTGALDGDQLEAFIFDCVEVRLIYVQQSYHARCRA